MRQTRIKLLMSLVLFALVAISVWSAAPAQASGAKALAMSSAVSPPSTPDLVCGDPDAGQGAIPKPPPSPMKSHRTVVVGEGTGTWSGWVQWASRIWATLNLRAAR
jgi:hypothetical protein